MNKEDYLNLYRKMYLIRLFEESCGENYSKGFIRGFLHLYIGQEAVAVGSIDSLEEKDFIVTHYRDHGHAIARGLSTNGLMAELFGKETGVSKGKGGSMHLFDSEKNFMGGHAIVGAQMPLAAGFALASQYRKEDSVTMVYFGDGATNQGTFHETMNLASVWKLPIVFFLENNFYGMGTSVERIRSNGKSFSNMAEGYGIPSTIVDGMDVIAVKETTKEVVDKVRSGNGPALIEATTFRFQGHSMADPAKYRESSEVDEWRKKDPVESFPEYIISSNIASKEEIEDVKKSVEDEMNAAVKFATESNEPDLESLSKDVYL
ncbi:MAG: pyruvate dehydrogenase (acetyl-transferring) E1 component subunit alpha [Dehalococcoidia bacterium]|jgi:pyruvate dehydrogenase E1 component alpha subunit|nr:pyruvate dehydrogenase (acetyl-transferring) E1 component subunit alpha [Dehalococcoidia bacterium]|tara:strand:+ start:318 stop:1274 length:957 start_codon:yes stop_codon:yes gene_type:complete